MKKLLLFLMLVLANLYVANAQGNEFIIRKPLSHCCGYSGEVQLDRNGNPCARVEVTVTRKVEIEGEYIMGNVEESMGKYSFWVVPPSKPNTKFITVRTEGLLPVNIDLWADGKLIGGEVYEVEVDAPANVVSQEELEKIEQARIENERKEKELKNRIEVIKIQNRRTKRLNLGANTVWYNFLAYQYAMKSNIGLMYGRCKGLGFYIKGSTNTRSFDYIDYKSSEEGWYHDKDNGLYYYKTADSEKGDDLSNADFDEGVNELLTDTLSRNYYGFGIKHSQFNVGVMTRLGTDAVYFALGLGYEWYHCDGARFKMADKESLGYDASLIFRFDHNEEDGAFVMMIGYSSPFGAKVDRLPNLHIGFGVSF